MFSGEIEELLYFEVNFVVGFTMHSAANVFGIDDESHRVCIAALVCRMMNVREDIRANRCNVALGFDWLKVTCTRDSESFDLKLHFFSMFTVAQP